MKVWTFDTQGEYAAFLEGNRSLRYNRSMDYRNGINSLKAQFPYPDEDTDYTSRLNLLNYRKKLEAYYTQANKERLIAVEPNMAGVLDVDRDVAIVAGVAMNGKIPLSTSSVLNCIRVVALAANGYVFSDPLTGEDYAGLLEGRESFKSSLRALAEKAIECLRSIVSKTDEVFKEDLMECWDNLYVITRSFGVDANGCDDLVRESLGDLNWPREITSVFNSYK
jgi:hypothetical protein